MPCEKQRWSVTGCLALKHSIQSYDGCNRTAEKIRAELFRWLKNASKAEIERFSFWKSCGINSHWVDASKLKSEMLEEDCDETM